MSAGRTLSATPSSSSALRAGYEELRREALERAPGEAGIGRGCALFRSRGMVAWMRAFLPLAPAVAAPAAVISPGPEGIPSLAREELTGLLVSMLLARKEG